MKPGTREEAAFRAIKRVCYSGADSVTLRVEVARRLAAVIPYEAYSFPTSDPETGLMTHGLAEGVPDGLVRSYVGMVYAHEQAEVILDRARSGEIVARGTSRLFADLLREQRMEHELNTVACDAGRLHGFLCLLRESRSRGYDEREIRFMRRIAPHLGRGLAAAATLDATAEEGGEASQGTGATPAGPGVVVVDGRGSVALRNASASMHLDDLADVGMPTGELPCVVFSVLALLRARSSSVGAEIDDAPGDATLRVRGRSGRRYTLRASCGEPGAAGDSSTVVTIEPGRPAEGGKSLVRLYGLSPRERQILLLAARGESTKGIAARLGLSTYTVQDHLGNACTKVGVRGRKALLAKIFFDAYAPALF
jgi:DNA-binding CsgD family transcriptional regulator